MLTQLNEFIETVKRTGSNQKFFESKTIPIGSIFDLLLEKNDSTRCCDDEEGAREQVISSTMARKWTNEKQGEVMVELIFKILNDDPKFSKILHFLFCLADSDDNQRSKNETLSLLGGLGHPKYDEFAPDWLKEGRYHGHTDENKILILDRIDRNKKYFKNTDLKIFGDRGNIIRRELNGAKDPINAIAKSLWPPGRNRTFAGIFDSKFNSTSPSPTPITSSFQPPLKRHKYLNFEEPQEKSHDASTVLSLAEAEELEIAQKWEMVQSMCSKKSRDQPLSNGPIRTWEERRSFKYWASTNQIGLFDLSRDNLKRVEIAIPNFIKNPQIDDVTISNALQFTAIGLESVLYPHWSDKSTIIETGTTREPTIDAVIGRGTIVRDVRSWKETLLNSTNQNPICYSIGLVANSMLEIVETCSLGLEFKNPQNILFFSRLFSNFSSFLKKNAELLIKNEANQDMNELIHLQQTSDSVFLYPLFVLIQASTQPLMASLNTWIHEGIWTNVMGLTIQNSSRFARRKNREFWTETYQREKTIPPIFVASVDDMLLIGKSLNFLRILAQDHFVFSLSFQGFDIRLRSGSELIKYQLELEEFHAQIQDLQYDHQEQYIREQESEIEKIRLERKLQNDAIDAEKERLKEAERLREISSREQAKKNYIDQIAARAEIEKRRIEIEKAEAEKREKYHLEKEKIIKQEKEKMLKEYENKIRKLRGEDPHDDVTNDDVINDDDVTEEKMEVDTPVDNVPPSVVEQMEIDQSETDLVKNRQRNVAHTPLGGSPAKRTTLSQSETRSIECEMSSTESAGSIPRRKITKRHMSDSAFVTGSMELKRNVVKTKPTNQKRDNTDTKMSEKEFIELANRLTLEQIEIQSKTEKKGLSKNKYINTFDTEQYHGLDSIDPLTFSENIRQSIELPISLSLRMANRALMFELLEKQNLMSIFGALSGLLLFQDGVFANSFCDRLFAHIETDYDKITRSLHSILEDSTRSATDKDSIQNQNYLRLAHNRSQSISTHLASQRLNEILLYMDIPYPCNVVIDDEATKLYSKLNKYLLHVKYAQWQVDRLWSQRKSWEMHQSIMVLRSEMGNFLGGLTNHTMRYVILNQRFTLKARITELNKKGDLNLDNLYDIHIRFLRNCRTQLFLDPGAVLIMKSIKRILAMIQQFCSIFEDFVVTQDGENVQKMLSIGKEFRTSMQNIIRMAHSAVIRMENPEQKESIRHLLLSIDFTGFYTEDFKL